jgi:hypothetical protein
MLAFFYFTHGNRQNVLATRLSGGFFYRLTSAQKPV